MYYQISLLLLISPFIGLSNQQKCDVNGLRNADSNMAKIFTVGSSGRKFPENKGNDLKKYCNETSIYVAEINDYKNHCLKDIPKQVIGVIMYSVNNHISQYCKSESKRLETLIQSTPCMNWANVELNKCNTKYIDSLLGAQNELDEKKKIPYTCCEYFKLFPCFETRMKRIRGCNHLHIQTAVEFVKGIFGDVIKIMCSDYNEDSDKCDQLGSPPKKRKNQRRSRSFVLPYVELFTSFKRI